MASIDEQRDKFANLPGIAWDQPTVYESECRVDPKSFTELLIAEPSDEAIKIVDIDAKASFKFFQQFKVPEKRHETVLQTFNRLQVQYNQLIERLEMIRKDGIEEQRPSDFGEPFNPPQLINKLRLMQKNLQAEMDSEIQGSFGEPSMNQSTKSVDLPCQEDDAFISRTSGKLASLGQRLARLEKLFHDEDKKKMGFLSFYTKEDNILGILKVLMTKMDQFDPDALEIISKEVTSAADRCRTLATDERLKDARIDNEKVNSIYEKVLKSEQILQELSQIAVRLSIQADFQQKLCDIIDLCAASDKLLNLTELKVDSIDVEMGMLKEKLQHNFDTIKQYIKAFDSRIDKITSNAK